MNYPKIISVLLIALCFNCFSQHKLNASLGYGLSFVRPIPKYTVPGIEINNMFGNSFIGGLGYKYQFKKLIGLGIDLSVSHINGTMLYESKGTATWYSHPLTYTRDEKNGFKFDYITVPVYVNFYHKHFSLDLDLQGSYAYYCENYYSDKFTYSNGGSTPNSLIQYKNDNSLLVKYDYGVFTALNITTWKWLDIFIRYYQGLKNLGNHSGDGLNNTQIILGARYNFFVFTKNHLPEIVAP